MKNTSKSILVLIAMSFLISLKCIAQDVDFTGKWTINRQKLDFGNTPHFKFIDTIEIRQNKDFIEIGKRGTSSGEKQTSVTESLNFNGNPTTVTIDNNRTKTSMIRWSVDKKVLIETEQYEWLDAFKNNKSYKATDTYALSDDKKSISLIRIIYLDNKASTVKAVYERF